MSPENLIAIVAVAVSLLGAAGTALVFVGKLSSAIEGLTQAVNRMDSTIERIESKTNDHDGRIRVLEAQD